MIESDGKTFDVYAGGPPVRSWRNRHDPVCAALRARDATDAEAAAVLADLLAEQQDQLRRLIEVKPPPTQIVIPECAVITSAVAAEREACAVECDKEAETARHLGHNDYYARMAAKHIRERK